MLARRRAPHLPYFDARFLAFAHRGGSHLPENEGRENTLHAFRNATTLGFRYLETDVHATRDGHLIAFHDDRLDRVTDGRGAVADLPLAEVRQARVGGEPIPTLDELFDSFPQARFNIDIKAPSAVQPLVDAISRHRAQQRVCVASFDPRRLAAFRRLAGTQVATAATARGVAWTAFVPLFPRLLPATGGACQVPVSYRVGAWRARVVTPRLIANAHAAGRQVHVWTIDVAAEMHTLIDMGVDGIVTDRPDILRDVLIARELWEGV